MCVDAYAIRFAASLFSPIFSLALSPALFLSLWKKAEGHRQNNERVSLSSVSIA